MDGVPGFTALRSRKNQDSLCNLKKMIRFVRFNNERESYLDHRCLDLEIDASGNELLGDVHLGEIETKINDRNLNHCFHAKRKKDKENRMKLFLYS